MACFLRDRRWAFDYRVSDATKNALGAKQWSMRRRPFFLGVGFHHPHTKWRIPQKTWSQYQDRRIAMPEITRKTRGAPFYAFGDNNIAPTAITIDGTHYKVPAKPYKEGKELPVSVVRELRRGYLASVAFLDVQVGRVLDQVDALHLSNDTVIIFTSDMGMASANGATGAKGPCEIDARVPLIVRDPHHTRGVADERFSGVGGPVQVRHRSRTLTLREAHVPVARRS